MTRGPLGFPRPFGVLPLVKGQESFVTETAEETITSWEGTTVDAIWVKSDSVVIQWTFDWPDDIEPPAEKNPLRELIDGSVIVTTLEGEVTHFQIRLPPISATENDLEDVDIALRRIIERESTVGMGVDMAGGTSLSENGNPSPYIPHLQPSTPRFFGTPITTFLDAVGDIWNAYRTEVLSPPKGEL